MTRTLIPTLAALAISAGLVHGQEPAAPSRVDADAQDLTLADALARIAADAGRTVVLDPAAVAVEPRVRLEPADAARPWPDAIRRVAARAGCDVSPLAGGTPVVHRVPRVSLDAEASDVREALWVLADLAGRAVVVGPAVDGTVTADLEDVPWHEALDALLRAVGASAGELDGVVVVTAEPLAGLAPVTGWTGSGWSGRGLDASGRAPRVSLDARGAPASAVLSAIGGQADCNLAVGPSVVADLDLALRSVPWHDALSIVAVSCDAELIAAPGGVLTFDRARRADVSALDRDAAALLLDVARQGRGDLIVTSTVERRLTAHLPSVRWRAAVGALAVAAGLTTWERAGHTVVGEAAPPEDAPADDEVQVACVDADLRQADVGRAVAQLREATGRNILVGPEVEATVTLRLRQVGWRDALEAIASVTGCRVSEASDAIVLQHPPDRAAVFDRADPRQALRIIARYAGFDVVVGGAPAGSVSANLGHGEWADALAALAEALGASLEQVGPRLVALGLGDGPERAPLALGELVLSATIAPRGAPRCALLDGRLVWEGEALGDEPPLASRRLTRVWPGRIELAEGEATFERRIGPEN